MTEKTYCLGQLLRPERHIPVDGVGNCTTCQKDERNKLCKNYKPIRIFTTDED